MKYQTISMKQFFPAKGTIYCVTIATVIFSHVKITCYFHVWRYHVFARKLTWYFIGVYIIKITIPWISIRETNCAIQWIVIYPVDSVIHLLNNWALGPGLQNLSNQVHVNFWLCSIGNRKNGWERVHNHWRHKTRKIDLLLHVTGAVWRKGSKLEGTNGIQTNVDLIWDWPLTG